MNLPATELHIWMIPALEAPPGHRHPLTAEEWQRAGRFHNPDHGRCWAAFRAALRTLLGQYSGCHPLALTLSAGHHGKPWLAQDPGLHFNLSHSADVAMLAITRVCPVGIDVELPRHLADMLAMVKRYFSTTEQAAIRSLPAAGREQAFYAIWTRKEAVLKASGLGLSMPLDAFDVPAGPLPDWRGTHIRDAAVSHPDYLFKDVTTAPGCAAAVALAVSGQAAAPCPDLRYFSYDGDCAARA